MVVVSLSITDSLLSDLDYLKEEMGFTNRSEAIRYAIRGLQSENMFEFKSSEKIVATITGLYDKSINKDVLARLQHDYDDMIKTLLHIHLDEVNCLEVMVVNGTGNVLIELLHKLRSLKGMKQLKYCITSCK
jgi:CopG family nickel-responsive transcriptional regulator